MKSLFRRLLITFSLIFTMNFFLAGVLLYYSLGSFATDNKKMQLESTCKNVCAAYERYKSFTDKNGFRPDGRMFALYLMSVADESGAELWIVEPNGIIEYSSSNLSATEANIVFGNRGYRINNQKLIDKVIESGKDGISDIGDFYGILDKEQYEYLSVAYNIYGVNGEVSRIIFAFVELPGLMRVRASVVNMYFLSGIIVLIIAITMIYIWSMKFTKPLKEMKIVAQNIAKGNFGMRADESYKYEMGELAGSFNKMAESLEEVEEVRRDFIANVSHELRTPMTSMRGFIDAILDGAVPEDNVRHYLEIVREETLRLGHLSEELLNLTGLQSGGYRPETETFDINELIRLCIIKLGPLFDEKKIDIEVQFSKERQMVDAEQASIDRVIINLLSNAVKYTEEGGKIRVTVTKSKGMVMVKVIDNGPGISEEDCKNIFERFFKIDKSRSNDKMGTGLGLSIAKQIILAHGGDIGVDSELGKGSAFYFTIKGTPNPTAT